MNKKPKKSKPRIKPSLFNFWLNFDFKQKNQFYLSNINENERINHKKPHTSNYSAYNGLVAPHYFTSNHYQSLLGKQQFYCMGLLPGGCFLRNYFLYQLFMVGTKLLFKKPENGLFYPRIYRNCKFLFTLYFYQRECNAPLGAR